MNGKRYVGKFIVSEFTNRRNKKLVKRVYFHLPLEILEDERFVLKAEDQVIVSIDDKGTMHIEKI